MKVLVITHTISPDSGGGRYSRAVLEEYVKQGISFTVLTEAGRPPENYELRTLLPLTSFGSALQNVLAVRKAAKNCDIVHAFDGWPYAVYGRLAILFTSKRLFVNAVGTYAVAALRSKTKGPFLVNAYRKAVRVFAISQFVQQNILKYVKLDNLSVVHLGTTPLPEPREEELSAFKERVGISSQGPILLTVGALKDRKGQLETVRAVSILKKHYPDILYCIVGSTKGSEAYVQKINEYVREEGLEGNVKILTDLKTDADLACIYTLCDVFLLNSKHDKSSEHSEGFGLVLLEAAQFGKPVVGSRGSGIPEAMDDGFNGYLVDEVEPQEIARVVEKVLDGYDTLSKNSVEVAKRFSWDKTARAYIKGYSN